MARFCVTAVLGLAVLAGGWSSAARAQDTLLSDTTVSVPTSYAEGALWTEAPGPWQGLLHVTFSCGLLLRFRWGSGIIPEDLGSYGIVLVARDSVDSSGYRREDGMTRSVGQVATLTVGSSDTLWTSSRVLPDTLLDLDSVIWWAVGPATGDTSLGGPGKWFAHTNVFYFPPINPMQCEQVPGHNTVMYARCKRGRAMKFQVDSLIVLDAGSGYTRCGMFRVRWAVDSAGNGLFRENPTAVEQPRPRAVQPNVSHSPRRAYDIRGRALEPAVTGASRAPTHRAKALTVLGRQLVWRE